MRGLRQRLDARVSRWARRRHGSQRSPVELQRNRIYILPTKAGTVFGLMLFVMLLGSMNYNNSMGLMLAFALGSFALICMHHCHRMLLGLTVRYGVAAPVHAGQTASIPVTLVNSRAYRRVDLRLSHSDDEINGLNLAPMETRNFQLQSRTHHRGRFAQERLRISCRYPCGLFQAWTWIYWDTAVLVYPAPIGTSQLPVHGGGGQPGQAILMRGDDELAELREFQHGDNLSRVAWKSLARSDEMHTKTFTAYAEDDLWIDWEDAAGLDTEQRLSQLTCWIVAARERQRRFGLRLPNATIVPNLDQRHTHKCLSALALYP